MGSTHAKRGVFAAALSTALVASLAATAVGQDEEVTLSFLIDNEGPNQVWAEAVSAAYMEQNPNVTIDLEIRPSGGDGDNIVKTRLATGEMTDVFKYNSGSLFQALAPTETLVDLSDLECLSNVSESFFPAVSAEGSVYGVPWGSGMGGGILYNKKVYSDLGLEVPTTWAEFEANNAAIKEAGIAPVAATFGSTWSSQLFVLSDYYNVQAQEPDFAERYTAGEAKYATSPAAMAGFRHLRPQPGGSGRRRPSSASRRTHRRQLRT